MIYLDHNSATRPCTAAIERMMPYLQEHWGAPFAPHKMGQELVSAIDQAHQVIYDLAKVYEPDRFAFASSGAEAINRIFWSVFLEVVRKTGKTHIIISEIEDAPTMQCAKRLEELGCTIKIARAKEGKIDVLDLASLISPRTALISVTMAHGLSGVIQPVDEIIAISKEKEVLLHLDAAYAAGKYLFRFDSDYLSFSGDLLHSVKGSGGIFAKEKAPLVPFVLGGNNLDVPSLMALSAAVQQSQLFIDTMGLEVVRLRDLFESKVKGKVLYQEQLRLPNTSMIAFEKVHHEALLYYLNRKGVYANIGGGYAGKIQEDTVISFALSRMTTEEEILKAADLINETVFELQKISEAI